LPKRLILLENAEKYYNVILKPLLLGEVNQSAVAALY